MIRDIILTSAEQQFVSTRAPHPTEWLIDNGGCYTADNSIDFADRLWLAPRFNPLRSRESNGIAAAFV